MVWQSKFKVLEKGLYRMSKKLLRSTGAGFSTEERTLLPTRKLAKKFASWLMVKLNQAVAQMDPKTDAFNVNLRHFLSPFGTMTVKKVGKEKFRVKVECGCEIPLEFMGEQKNHNFHELESKEHPPILNQVRSADFFSAISYWSEIDKAGANGLS